MFICAGKSESFEFAKSVGIGLIESAIETTKICLHYTPKQLIFIGSAGSYNNNICIGDIFYSFCAMQIEISFLQNQSYTPIDNMIKMENYNIVSHGTILKQNIDFLKVPKVIVNSSNYITNTSKFNSIMLNAGVSLENMEFFSVLKVAQSFNIPSLGIFCVSNYVNKNAHKEFIENHHKVKNNLTHFCLDNFISNPNFTL